MKHYPLVIADYMLGFSTEAFPLFALLSQNWAEIVNIMHTKKLDLAQSNLYFHSSFSVLLETTLSNFMLRQSEAIEYIFLSLFCIAKIRRTCFP